MAKIIPMGQDGSKSAVTVCTRCEHFQNLDPDSSHRDIWHNHVCKATPLPTKVDPYDGVEKPYGINDLGVEYFSETEFQFCRKVNDGKCPKFQAR